MRGMRRCVRCVYEHPYIGSGRDHNEYNYSCNGTIKRDAAVPV
jgi:hypothetical protein